tara:strand:+ start:219 stop:506 length:288 start_codon:yes stop_codon:yes gene_type:complete
MVMTKIVDGVEIELTAEEESLRIKEENDYKNDFDRVIKELREKRNNLLSETDWWGASDNTMSSEQTQYRQDLRDITNGLTTVEEVNAVEFPTKPS